MSYRFWDIPYKHEGQNLKQEGHPGCRECVGHGTHGVRGWFRVCGVKSPRFWLSTTRVKGLGFKGLRV